MNHNEAERIRRAAILIASLEETLAEQLLHSLPEQEAKRVLDEIDRLGEIDPEEQADVLAEFRRASRQERTPEAGVEFTYSAPPQVLRAAAVESTTPVSAGSDQIADEAGPNSDATLMAALLTDEHPQTIAAALSRLGHDRGAAVFAALPALLQAEVLDRLANLEPADEEAVKELESQLQRRIEQHRQRRERAAAVAEMARRMLEKTAPTQRAALLARISPGEASSLQSDEATREPTSQSAVVFTRSALNSERDAPETHGPELVTSGPQLKVWGEPADHVATKQASHLAALEDCSHDLEALDDRMLLEALRVVDERTVQRALSASSEAFLNRIASKLPRRQAARLRKLVRSIGPTRLTELRQAQHELLQVASHGRIAA